ncbi:MAG: ion transporter [Melioribacteraceae bacterium]|nr:MAG: ion transporter [Melioribacteraceae bacterium]
MLKEKPGNNGWRDQVHEVIFEADTYGGKLFDIGLILSIILSVLAVMLDSIAEVRHIFGGELYLIEWIFTVLFSIEYIMRIISIKKPFSYIFSFYGIVDLLAILPTFLSLLFPGTQYLLVIRILRVLRIFRILKFVQYITEAKMLRQALLASRRKITVFLFTVLTVVVIMGAIMYLVEGAGNGFTSIPKSIYWAIVTLTTVGYGDISPATPLGQMLASVLMIMGYGIIAVPTGIVTVEFSRLKDNQVNTQSCPACGKDGHDNDAVHCKYCGHKL